MKWMVLVGGAMLMAGCSLPQPQKVVRTSNPHYEVSLLFTDSNGVSVYRFYDLGEPLYYTVGPAGSQMLPTHRVETPTGERIEPVRVLPGPSTQGK